MNFERSVFILFLFPWRSTLKSGMVFAFIFILAVMCISLPDAYATNGMNLEGYGPIAHARRELDRQADMFCTGVKPYYYRVYAENSGGSE